MYYYDYSLFTTTTDYVSSTTTMYLLLLCTTTIYYDYLLLLLYGLFRRPTQYVLLQEAQWRTCSKTDWHHCACQWHIDGGRRAYKMWGLLSKGDVQGDGFDHVQVSAGGGQEVGHTQRPEVEEAKVTFGEGVPPLTAFGIDSTTSASKHSNILVAPLNNIQVNNIQCLSSWRWHGVGKVGRRLGAETVASEAVP